MCINALYHASCSSRSTRLLQHHLAGFAGFASNHFFHLDVCVSPAPRTSLGNLSQLTSAFFFFNNHNILPLLHTKLPVSLLISFNSFLHLHMSLENIFHYFQPNLFTLGLFYFYFTFTLRHRLPNLLHIQLYHPLYRIIYLCASFQHSPFLNVILPLYIMIEHRPFKTFASSSAVS